MAELLDSPFNMRLLDRTSMAVVSAVLWGFILSPLSLDRLGEALAKDKLASVVGVDNGFLKVPS